MQSLSGHIIPPSKDSEYRVPFLVSVTTSSVLSILGSIFIIACYMSFKRLKTFAYQLIVCLQITDFIYNLSFVLSPIFQKQTEGNEPNFICTLQGVMLQFSQLSSLFWAGVISFNIYITSVKQKSNPEQYLLLYLIAGFGIPMIIALIPAVTRTYDEIYFYCWIQGSIDNYYIIFFYLIPLWFTIIYIIYTIYKVKNFLEKQGLMEENHTFYARIRFYPLVLILANGFSTLHRTLLLINVDPPDFFFIIDHTLTNFQGFLNAIYYGLNYNVQKELKNYFSKRKLSQQATSEAIENNKKKMLHLQQKYDIYKTFSDPNAQNTDDRFQSMLQGYDQTIQ